MEEITDVMDIIDKYTHELFVDGMYARTIILLKNTIAVGHVHKKRVINILSQGSLLIKTEDSEEGKVITAPVIFITEPGSRKSVFALEDSVLTNILRTDKTTTKEVEEEAAEPHNGTLPYMRKKEITI